MSELNGEALDLREENAQLEAELRQIMAEIMQPYNRHINALIKQVDHLTGELKKTREEMSVLHERLENW